MKDVVTLQPYEVHCELVREGDLVRRHGETKAEWAGPILPADFTTPGDLLKILEYEHIGLFWVGVNEQLVEFVRGFMVEMFVNAGHLHVQEVNGYLWQALKNVSVQISEVTVPFVTIAD